MQVFNGPISFIDGDIKNIADVQGQKLIEKFPDNFSVAGSGGRFNFKKSDPDKDKAMKASEDK